MLRANGEAVEDPRHVIDLNPAPADIMVTLGAFIFSYTGGSVRQRTTKDVTFKGADSSFATTVPNCVQLLTELDAGGPSAHAQVWYEWCCKPLHCL